MKKEDIKLSDKQSRTETKRDWVSKGSALIRFLPSFPLENSNL
jgi:hypothetical protein